MASKGWARIPLGFGLLFSAWTLFLTSSSPQMLERGGFGDYGCRAGSTTGDKDVGRQGWVTRQFFLPGILQK